LISAAARLGKEFSDFYDAAGNLKPDVPKKKPSIYVVDEDAERATRKRLGVCSCSQRQPCNLRLWNRRRGRERYSRWSHQRRSKHVSRCGSCLRGQLPHAV